jgi:DNA-directed RNA polymerase subunit M
MMTHRAGKVVCSKCGHIEGGEKLAMKETMAKAEKGSILKKDSKENLPETDKKCPKCSHMRAYFWALQTRSSDEGETAFFKCVKCNHTWREYR